MGMHGMRLRFQKGDLLAVAVTLAMAAAVFVLCLPRGTAEAAMAEIYLGGALIRRRPLDTPTEFEVTGDYHNTVTVRDGQIRITASDCPGEDCVHSGPISAAGRSIVCLPNGVEIRVVGQSADVDFVVG